MIGTERHQLDNFHIVNVGHHEKRTIFLPKTKPKMKDRVMITSLAMIDESNDPGSRVHGNHYLMAATVIDSDERLAFARITEEYQDSKEMKFNTHGRFRYSILERISSLEPRIYSISVKKPRRTKWTSEEQNDVHRRLLYRLVLLVTRKERAKKMELVVDENDRISVPKVKKIVAEVSKKTRKDISCLLRYQRTTTPFRPMIS